LLLGGEISGPSIPIGRVTGVALLALDMARRSASYEGQNRASRGLATAMLLYKLGVVLILGMAGLWSQPAGVALWPVIVLHTVIGIWCVGSLRRNFTI